MSAFGKRVAAEDPPSAHERTADQTKAPDGFVRVLATGRVKAAHRMTKQSRHPPMIGGEGALVEADERLTQAARNK